MTPGTRVLLFIIAMASVSLIISAAVDLGPAPTAKLPPVREGFRRLCFNDYCSAYRDVAVAPDGGLWVSQ